VIVLDASAMVELLRPTRIADEVMGAVTGQRLHAPHLLDVEVLQVFRRFRRRGELSPEDVEAAAERLADFPMRRHAHVALLPRVLELSHNATAYDAVYLALAEALGATLLTCDSKLAAVPQCQADVLVVG